MNHEETIFAEALSLPEGPTRDAYLARACLDNPGLRREVNALLVAHGRAGGILDTAPRFSLPPVPDEATLIGTRVGPYKLLEKIGSGGMGVVYMAEQTHPVKRRVALKLIKPGMDSGQVVARFEAERQVLTMMDHPNIARVLDAGTTDTGRPYFVMELVRGVPITEYCDAARLSTRARLELFATVCLAVQHAHTKGVIHRDLKPGNVLVTLHDDKPVTKVIDFGVAKATGHVLTDRTLFTQFAQMIGTPLYMSPEQAQLSGLDVDTRSDVYSLGVLLYELLTGNTPFDKQRLQEAAYDEMRRIIREEDPPNPSTRLSTLGETLATVSAHRSTDPRKLNQLVRGELDWIVMKALEKDRTLRYESASGMGRDIERYLSDQPVEACPHTVVYRLRKFARRNRTAFATAGFAATAILAGVVLLAASNLRLHAEQRRTSIERARAEAELVRADENLELSLRALDEIYLRNIEGRVWQTRVLSDQDRADLQKGLSFYSDFARRNTGRPGFERATARAYRRLGYLYHEARQFPESDAAFAKGAATFEVLLAGTPEDDALRRELASCYTGLSWVHRLTGRWPSGEEYALKGLPLRHAIAAGPGVTPSDRMFLAHNLWLLADYDEAARRFDVVRARLAESMAVFTALAAEFPDNAFYRQEIAAGHRHLARQVLVPTGRFDDAFAEFRIAGDLYARLADASPGSIFMLEEWLVSLRGMDAALRSAGKPDRADALRPEFARVEQRILTPFQRSAALKPLDPWAHQFLGDRLAGLGRLADAEACFRRAIELEPRDFGRHHNLADVLLRQSRYRDASESYSRSLDMRPDPGTFQQLGFCHVMLGDWASAVPAFARAAELAPDDHWPNFRWVVTALLGGDDDACARASAAMYERFAQSEDPLIIERTVKACLLSPASRIDPEQLLTRLATINRADQSVGWLGWYDLALGLTLYRAGRDEDALAALDRVGPLKVAYRDAAAQACRAMALHRLGRPDVAREALGIARRRIAEVRRQAGDDAIYRTEWLDHGIATALCREAESRLATAPPP